MQLSRRSKRRLDLAGCALLGVEFQREAWTASVSASARATLSLLGLALLGSLLARHARPLPATAIGFGSLVGTAAVGGGVFAPFFAVFFLAYALGARAGEQAFAAGIAVGSVASAAAVLIDPYPTTVANVASSVLLQILGPAFVGRAVRDRARLNDTLAETRRRHEQERVRRAEQGVLAERGRIAGELHDVVAHALSAMVVQATAARRAVGPQPALAGAAFAAVEETGRDALTEIRGVLGVLRRGDEEMALAPQPSLAHVDGLVRRVGRSGLPVSLRVEGEPRPLGAGVDLAAYRALQEALGAARDQGGAGRADVRIAYGRDRLELTVADDGPGPRTTLATAERVVLYGGRVTAGGRPEGGHRVAVRLPIGGAA